MSYFIKEVAFGGVMQFQVWEREWCNDIPQCIEVCKTRAEAEAYLGLGYAMEDKLRDEIANSGDC